MPSRSRGVIILLLSSLGCVGPPRRETPESASLPTRADPYAIAQDEIARARVLSDSGAGDLAAAAFARADQELQAIERGSRRERLAVELYSARGDLLLKQGRPRRGGAGLRARAAARGGSSVAEEVAARLYLIAERRNDAAAMETYRRLLGSTANPALVAARTRFGLRGQPARTEVASDASGLGVIGRGEARAPHAQGPEEPMSQITRITVHHSGDQYSDTGRQQAASVIYDIQGVHLVNQKHWADISYHYVIDPAAGKSGAGARSPISAHAGNNALNRGNVGICLLGDFEQQSNCPAARRTDPPARPAARERYHIPREEVYTHSEMHREGNLAATLCPGRNLQVVVDGYRSLATAKGSTGAARPRRAGRL
ncbi:MAG: peptidoglycan recognition family protein [Planctomycetota bacterium]